MTKPDPLRSLLAYVRRESERRAKGAHPGMTRLRDDELAALRVLFEQIFAEPELVASEARP